MKHEPAIKMMQIIPSATATFLVTIFFGLVSGCLGAGSDVGLSSLILESTMSYPI
jgi:hypothetical protein